MTKRLKTICSCLLVVAAAAGCAAPKPLPFQLVDSESRVQKGMLFPGRQLIEAMVDGQLYKGFYIFASGEAYSETFGGWRSFPRDTQTTYSSNSARAQLVSDKGQRLSCEFLFESRRAIGECRSPSGAVYQLIADGN
ncbi:hypothetical protein [Sideroxydans sp. CL21]|uniref:hypothetical protein n=1 Tax=Sideroxydans sp. CL21 TaxID=2600596 RepID=UPI0024BC86F4|nr:hypothetical protein [Sideroxydans sp. CL21]